MMEVVYVTAKRNVIQKNQQIEQFSRLYQDFCLSKGIPFIQKDTDKSILSPDNTSFFCTSGMHHLKHLYQDSNYHNTFANIQTVFRFNDFDEISDNTHYLMFHMIGLFSFRQLSISQTIEFIMDFLLSINIIPDYVTIHKDKYHEWKNYYAQYPVDIRIDSDNCTWSADGKHFSYCTELFYKDVEIGNIVHPNGNCIDVGLGLERLMEFYYPNYQKIPVEDLLIESIEQMVNEKIIDFNSQEIHKKYGLVFKKLLIKLMECAPDKTKHPSFIYDHPAYQRIYLNKRNKILYFLSNKQNNTKNYQNKNKQWWFDVHGINPLLYDYFTGHDTSCCGQIMKILDFFEIDL